MSEKRWMLRHRANHHAFWDHDLATWADRDSGTRFNDSERAATTPPLDGEWICDLGTAGCTDLYPPVVNEDRCVVLCGNPTAGVRGYGPFDTADDASDFAEVLLRNEDWWVLDLTPVQCDEDGNWVVPMSRAVVS